MHSAGDRAEVDDGLSLPFALHDRAYVYVRKAVVHLGMSSGIECILSNRHSCTDGIRTPDAEILNIASAGSIDHTIKRM